ncbi:MAG: hypothetical protein ACLRFH_01900 [Opitutales bacterium]
MAWMAIRPFSTNVHADNINWEEVSHFFNFNTIEAEKRTNLETNIRLLVEEQLKLPSGQNLWKAFQFWKNQHPELGFQFEFALIDESEAYIELKNYKNQTFLFEIALNKAFAEDFKIPFWQVIKNNLHQKTNLGLKKLLNENMLYRPCLIKLVDLNDPSHWEYHLREQELPFFITLAHEFLHALNQLERIDICWFTFEGTGENLLSTLDNIVSTCDFLTSKLNLSKDNIIFQKTCKELWGNNHFLDEMTVILGSGRRIGEAEFVFIGETTFLREYFQDNTIISWSHDSARNINFWQKMSVILNKNYVNEIFESNCFCVCELNMQHVCINLNLNLEIQKNYLFKYNNSLPFKDCIKAIEKNMNKIKHLNCGMAIRASILSEANKSKNIQAFEILKTSKKHNINLLPKYYTTIYLEGYTIEDLSNNSDIVLYEDLFKKFKLLIENEEGILLKINEENKVQYYEYKPSKQRHYFSTLKENQQIYDIINKVKSQNLYYYNGISFQKLLKN